MQAVDANTFEYACANATPCVCRISVCLARAKMKSLRCELSDELADLYKNAHCLLPWAMEYKTKIETLHETQLKTPKLPEALVAC